MTRLEPTRALALKVWWAFVWRAFLAVVASGFVIGLLVAFFAVAVGLSRRAVENLTTLFGVVIGVGVSIEVMFRVLRKRFAAFEIALIARE